MKFQNQVLSLHSDALPADTLMIAKMTGEERLSGLFRFELDLICEDKELDLESVLYAPARLAIKVSVRLASGSIGTATREIAGVLESLEQHDEGQGWVKYKAVLVPKLWQTTRSYRSRIFMDLELEELITAVLQKDGLDPGLDFEFQLAGDYPKREYVVQYEESDWQFVARWLEHEGVWFQFVNEGGEEKVVFGDSTSAYAASPFGSTYPYRPEASGDGGESDRFTEEEIRTFHCRQSRLPATVTVNDYNWRVPSARLHYSEDVREGGTGLQAQYNDHFKTEAQGKALARIRKEELACRARVFQGRGSCRAFRPGTTFTLEGHFREDFNRGYLLTAVRHEAEQMISLESATVTGFQYENTFEAIPDDVTYRPERAADWPSIKGVMHAKVDAEGDGRFAELDELGRYKLRMPFDEHGEQAEPGKASRWVRMAQPYAGQNSGFHFPLLKGAEVLVTHIDGDPDRPVISGAVPNPETESPSTGANYTRNSIRTTSGNVMQIDDNENKSGFMFRDSLSSRVTDYRWRTGSGAPARGDAAAGSPGPGGGSAMPSTPAAVPGGGRGGDPEGEIISTVWDEGVDEDDGAIAGWKAFFRDGGATPTAFERIASWGRYTDETEQNPTPLGLSVSNGLLPTNQDLTEANLVTMLNHLLLQHPRRGGITTSWANTELNGFAGFIAGKCRNFEALAAGSTLGVEVGDSIKLTIGDSYEYTDGSYEVKIGTGGLSHSETRGDATNNSYTWGDVSETSETTGDTVSTTTYTGNKTETETTTGASTKTSFNYGAKAEYSHDFSASVTFSLTGGALSETEVKLGAFNSNSVTIAASNENTVNVGIFNTNEILLLGKAEIEISIGGTLKVEINAAAALEVELGVKNLFKTKNFSAILSEDTVTLNELNANLKKSDADILKDKVAINETNSKLNEVKNALNKNVTALNNGQTALSASVTALSKNDQSMMKNALAMQNMQTSGITMIQ